MSTSARNLGIILAAAILATAILPAPALANDSEAEWALGGLTLKANEAISMDSEDLFVSAAEVKVDYTYTNHSDADQAVLVSFPLPALPGNPEWVEYGSYPDFGRLDFSTAIDGKPVDWQVVVRAGVGGRDVTAQVAAEGFPLEWYQDEAFIAEVSNMAQGDVERLTGMGLIRHEDDWGGNDMMPAWEVQRSIVREQTFPAHATVHVAHRYTPLIGGSAGGLLDHFGEADYAEETAFYRQKYCTDASFVAGFRKRQREEAKKQSHEWYAGYGQTWIGYVLSSGANWKGSIGSFRLVVDKGEPDALVSFCMDGAKKISPTQFEVRKVNYEPDRDLDIVILRWFSDED